jgi:hypothetical protein
MENQVKQLLIALGLLAAVNLQPSNAFAQGTAFTYQGQLKNNGNPASGTYNLTFTLFNTNITGVPVAEPVTNNAVGVTNGLFTVLIDFGAGAFTGATNWLEIGVETNGASSFITLTPRQQMTPTPYAIYAENANNLSGTLPASQLTSIGNTLGNYNFFVGPSGNSTTSGSDNTANGSAALESNTSGSDNTAIGGAALALNTSGSNNTAIGNFALYANASGSDNTALGGAALMFLGDEIGIEGGSNNIALGYQAGYNFDGNESGNIDIGNQGVTGENNIIRIGSGQSQTFIAGVINGNGGGLTNLNVNAAKLSGTLVNSQLANSSITVNAGTGLSGGGTVALGGTTTLNNAGVTALTGGGGVTVSAASGLVTLGSTATSANTANAIVSRDGSGNFSAASITLAGNLIAGVINGNGAGLTNLNASQLTSIGNNNFFAGSAGKAANSGSDNTAMGAQALTNNTSGTGNTAFGFGALQNATGNFNFGYGYLAGSGLTTGANNVDIAAAGQSGDNAFIRIGTPGIQTATYIAGISGATAASGVAVYVNSSGQLGTLTSSRRYKQDIQGMDQASDVLYALQPVTFKYKPGIDPQGIPQFGLVAEDVEKVAPDLVAHDDQGKIYTVRYQAVDAMLLNEFLKEHRTVEEQTRTVQEQSAEIQNLKQQNESLEKRLNILEKAVASIGETSGATFALNSKATENR